MSNTACMAQNAQTPSLVRRYTLSMLHHFTDHPASVDETYTEHLATATGFGFSMIVGGLACLVHGLFPWLCTRTGSDTIRALHHRMVTHRTTKSQAPQAQAAEAD